jgi:hypothetical protein
MSHRDDAVGSGPSQVDAAKVPITDSGIPQPAYHKDYVCHVTPDWKTIFQSSTEHYGVELGKEKGITFSLLIGVRESDNFVSKKHLARVVVIPTRDYVPLTCVGWQFFSGIRTGVNTNHFRKRVEPYRDDKDEWYVYKAYQLSLGFINLADYVGIQYGAEGDVFRDIIDQGLMIPGHTEELLMAFYRYSYKKLGVRPPPEPGVAYSNLIDEARQVAGIARPENPMHMGLNPDPVPGREHREQSQTFADKDSTRVVPTKKTFSSSNPIEAIRKALNNWAVKNTGGVFFEVLNQINTLHESSVIMVTDMSTIVRRADLYDPLHNPHWIVIQSEILDPGPGVTQDPKEVLNRVFLPLTFHGGTRVMINDHNILLLFKTGVAPTDWIGETQGGPWDYGPGWTGPDLYGLENFKIGRLSWS